MECQRSLNGREAIVSDGEVIDFHDAGNVTVDGKMRGAGHGKIGDSEKFFLESCLAK
jgi:hypothetical protein